MNGVEVADSELCIEFLVKKFEKDLSKDFAPADNGIARSFVKMNEESLFWCMVLHRFVYQRDSSQCGIPGILLFLMGLRIDSRSKAQGYGLHSKVKFKTKFKTHKIINFRFLFFVLGDI